VLIGVHDELDAPTRHALRAHVDACRACADAWIEETEFRRLMHARPSPAPSPQLEARLLAVPAADLGLVRLRWNLARLGPTTLLALGVALGMLWYARRDAGPDHRADRSPAAAQAPMAHAGRRTPANAPPSGQPTAVSRQRPGDLSRPAPAPMGAASDVQREAGFPRRSPPTVPGAHAPQIGTGARRAAAHQPANLAPTQANDPVTFAPQATAPNDAPPGAPRPGDAGASHRGPGEVPAIPTTAPPPVPPDTATPPPASPTAAAWQLKLAVRVDDPAADLSGARVVIQIEAAVQDGWRTLYEEPLLFAGRIAQDSPRLGLPPPYEVELFAGLPGHALCAGESRVRTIDAAALEGGMGEIGFRLCPETAPSPVPPTATPGTPEPAPTATPPTAESPPTAALALPVASPAVSVTAERF
jgi:hypothetical protein